MLETEDGIEVVGEAGSGAEAVAIAAARSPDVVLMDLRMPGVDGVVATGRILTANSEVKVVVLTTYETDATSCARWKPERQATCSRTPHRLS
jgi:DNA-binding NarL/FixJ family response regulator